jgi:hypothetical protein
MFQPAKRLQSADLLQPAKPYQPIRPGLRPSHQRQRPSHNRTAWRLLSGGLMLSLLCCHTALQADPVYWNGGNGTWYTAADWSTGNVPSSADDVFNITGYATITIDNGSVQAAGTLTNYGVIDVSSGSLNVAQDVFNTTQSGSSGPAIIQVHGNGNTITLNSSGGSLINSGVIQAYDGGTLNINATGIVTNQAGAYIATDYSAPTDGGNLNFAGTASLDNAGTIGSTAIGSGGYVSGTLTGAFTNESTGVLTLDSGSNLTLGSTNIASSNAGTITITNGSTLTLNALTFTNSNIIDGSGGGNVLINVATQLTNQAGAYIATDYSAAGNGSTVTLNGTGNLDNAGTIGSTTIGSGGYVSGTLTGTFTNENTGVLTLDSGSNLTLGSTSVASSNAGTITVTDSNLTYNSFLTLNASTFTNSGVIDTSNEGEVSFNIAGSLVNAQGAGIYTDYTSNTNGGSINFSGAGSLDNAGYIGSVTIGSGGAIFGSLTGAFTNESTGTLALDSGSSLALGNTSVASSNAGTILAANSSNLTINASTFTNTGTLAAASQGAVTVNGAVTLGGGKVLDGAEGTISFTGPSVSQTGGTTRVDGVLNTTATLALTGGDLVGSGTINGNVINSGGTVQPSVAGGTLTLNGQYTQSGAGTLEVALGGTQPGQYSLLTITGAAMLGGQLDVTLVNGFTPTTGDIFNFLSYGSRIGTFDILSSLQPDYVYTVSYNDTTDLATLTVAAVPETSTLVTGILMLVGGGLLLRRRSTRQAEEPATA